MTHTEPEWFRHAIFYEVLVRSFCDSDCDGTGDLAGLASKLDYLQWLGVDCLWLPPFFESPLADGGYDVSDYTKILPKLGDLEAFDALVQGAHERGMKVIIDFVMNHTSDQHPWFQASRNDPDGPYGDYYVWADDDSLYNDARIIFLDTETSNWSFDEVRGQYYWHRFFWHQPDLNYDNPRVLEEMLNALRFWLDRGLDGFRLDAVPYLVERPGTNGENLPETHAVLKAVRRVMDAEYPGAVLLCEANQWPREVVDYFGDGDECHLAFHFPVMPRMYLALRTQDRTPLNQILADTPMIPDGCQWGTFLRNHDELTLEMVSPEERDYMWDEYAPEARMRSNLGIRRRLAPLLDNDPGKIRLLNAMLLALPGSPVLYYGDEIGMGDNIWLHDRDGVRTPMQWTDSPDAGFSSADPERFEYPLIDTPEYDATRVNVAAQQADPTSLLHWTRSILALRKRYPLFGAGHFLDVGGSNLAVFAFLRYLDGKAMLCAFNLSDREQTTELELGWLDGAHAVHAWTGSDIPGPREHEPYEVVLPPHGYTWIALDGFAKEMTDVWWNYLNESRWFGGRGRDGHVTDVRPLPWLTKHSGRIPITWPAVRPELVDVEYADGGTETYQVVASYRPVTGAGPAARGVVSLAGVGPVRVATLTDDPEAMMELAWALTKRRSSTNAAGWTLDATLAEDAPSLLDAAPEVFSGEQSNTTIAFGDVLVKLFRRPLAGHNPEVEALLALDGSPSVPRGYGAISAHHDHDGEHIDLAIVTQKVAGARDGWDFALDQAAVGADDKTWAHDLGVALADVHRTLAAALPTQERDGDEVADEMVRRLDESLAAVPALEELRDGLVPLFDGVRGTTITGQRLHGDFHLGQTLLAEDGSWKIIDFEGEPLKPLAERTAPDSVWRDVAGMIRSLDYARASSPDAESQRAREWCASATSAFLDGYAEGRGTAISAADRAQIDAYIADKASYEVVYEARNRPAWVSIPLRAIAELVKEHSDHE